MEWGGGSATDPVRQYKYFLLSKYLFGTCLLAVHTLGAVGSGNNGYTQYSSVVIVVLISDLTMCQTETDVSHSL